MAKRFLYKSVVTTHTSPEGVEHTEETKELVHLESEPFYIVYTRYIKWIYGINSGKTLAVLLRLLDMMEFNTGIVDVSRTNRQILIAELDLSQSSLTQCLNRLIEKEALYKRSIIDKRTGEVKELKGSYQVNPIMFWKGTLKDRKALKVQFIPLEEEELRTLDNNEYSYIDIQEDEE